MQSGVVAAHQTWYEITAFMQFVIRFESWTDCTWNAVTTPDY